VFRDPRIHVVGGWGVERGDPSDIRSWTHDARRVFVQAGGPLFGPGLRAVASVLEPEGFTVQQHAFAWNVVQVWQR
jgi:hypothetical protein